MTAPDANSMPGQAVAHDSRSANTPDIDIGRPDRSGSHARPSRACGSPGRWVRFVWVYLG